MLPNLDKLALVPTCGFLGNAQWPEEEECSICSFPLAAPTQNVEYVWPFSGEGTGFTVVACIQGHAFHKGCLRAMVRISGDNRCPDCRKPMFAEVLKDVGRTDPEQVERERRQDESEEEEESEEARLQGNREWYLEYQEEFAAREESEEERLQRNREEREEEEREEREEREYNDLLAQRRAQLEDMGYRRHEPGPQHPWDTLVMWSFRVKGHIQDQSSIQLHMSDHFFNYMRRSYYNHAIFHEWSKWLLITMDLQSISPSDQGLLGEPMRYTKVRCKLFLTYPGDVSEFVSWFRRGILVLGYADAMHECLGITTAKPVGELITEVGSIQVEGTELQASRIQNDPLVMTAAEYQAWPEWAFAGPTGRPPFTSQAFWDAMPPSADDDPDSPEDSDDDGEPPARRARLSRQSQRDSRAMDDAEAVR